jgi:hypothetical protein
MKRTKLLMVSICFVIGFLLTSCAEPNDPAVSAEETGVVSGIVTLSDNSVDITEVTLRSGDAETHPDANGAYQLELLAGEHTLKASCTGYYSEDTTITVVADEALNNVDFALTVIVEDHYETVGFAMDLQVSDSLLYVAEDQTGFSIYNYTTDQQRCWYDNDSYENIRIIREVEEQNRVVIYNKYGTAAGLLVFDTSDITNPQMVFPLITQIVGVTDVETFPDDQGNLGILWLNDDGSSRKFHYDGYLDPSNQWVAGFAHTFYFEVNGMDVTDDYIYVASEQMGLYICGREWGETVGIVDTPGEALDVKVVDNYAYVADKTQGLSVIDVTDPANPVLLSTVDTDGYAQKIDVSNEYVAVASGGGGVYVFDRTNPAAPTLLHHVESLIDYTYVAALKGDLVFAGTKSGVFKINIK